MFARTIRRTPSLMLWLSAALALAGCGPEPTPGGDSITAADLAGRVARGSAPMIFDVRTPDEYAAGHVPGAINLPHTEVAARAEEFAAYKGREVVVYCGSGMRAASAASDLKAAGFARVLDLEGHMQGWQAGGYPLDEVTESN